jgi:hypothetical protein
VTRVTCVSAIEEGQSQLTLTPFERNIEVRVM